MLRPRCVRATHTRRFVWAPGTLALLAFASLVSAGSARADVIPGSQSVRCPPGASADPHAARCVADACAGDCGPIASCLPRKLCVSRGSTHGGSVTVVHAVCTTTEDCGERGVCEELDVCVYPEDAAPRPDPGPRGCGQCGVARASSGAAAGVLLALAACCAVVLRRKR
jgi:hypothetical protein